jgi:hypothetical protein
VAVTDGGAGSKRLKGNDGSSRSASQGNFAMTDGDMLIVINFG